MGTYCTGLIRRGSGEYEGKRISEAEKKRAQRQARAKKSPTQLSSSVLSCSVCNRQFRAKIGVISHLRTQKIKHFTHLIRIGYCHGRTMELFSVQHAKGNEYTLKGWGIITVTYFISEKLRNCVASSVYFEGTEGYVSVIRYCIMTNA